VLLEQLGAPIPAIPVLVVAGALSMDRDFSAWQVLLVAVGASLIADGVWFLVGDSHNSVALEMEDQIVLVESPLSDRYARRLFEIANRLVPGKMVRTVVSSHHHFDHTGGLRYAAAQSATIVVSSLEKAFYERAFSNPNSVVPDALARSRNKARLTAVDGKRVFPDPVRPVEVHELLGDHSRGWLMVYLPKEKVLVEADAFHIWPPGAPPPTEPIGRELSLVNNLERLNLQVERILPLHGRASTVQELYERVVKKPPG